MAAPYFLLDHAALGTYRLLPAAMRRRMVVHKVARVLSLKAHYLEKLSYDQKCRVSFDKVVEVVHLRLRAHGIRMRANTVRTILLAEEHYYRQLAEQALDAADEAYESDL